MCNPLTVPQLWGQERRKLSVTTLESQINGSIGEAESRQSESQQVFDAMVSDLSQRLAAMRKELEEEEAALGAMTVREAWEIVHHNIEDQPELLVAAA